MEVYNQLRHGFLESVYQEALEIEFRRQSIPYIREQDLTISYKGEEMKQTYKADFVCYGKIIVELKAVTPTIVKANGIKNCPICPFINATGNKTTMFVPALAKTATTISVVPLIAPSILLWPPLIFATIFSRTTIELVTRIPIERPIESNVAMLMV